MNKDDRNNILKAIFGTRSINGALALMNGLTDGWFDVYTAVMNS